MTKLTWVNGYGEEDGSKYSYRFYLNGKEVDHDKVEQFLKDNHLTTNDFRGGNATENTKRLCEYLDVEYIGESVLKALRKSRGLTQTELAIKSEIPFRTIQDLEADVVMHITTTRADNLYKIAKALDVPMEYFFKG